MEQHKPKRNLFGYLPSSTVWTDCERDVQAKRRTPDFGRKNNIHLAKANRPMGAAMLNGTN